ncbi:MAG: hypothetical protein AABZ31_13055, partial [Bdellovibrionota bacterium]
MKSLILAIVLLSFNSAFANKITTFTCELEKYPKQKIVFKMQDVDTPDMTFVHADEEDDYSPIFSSTSKNEIIQQMIRALNEQGGDFRTASDRIGFFGDSAGIDFVYLDLYKNSNYTKG